MIVKFTEASLNNHPANQALDELGVPPERVLISNKLAWKRVPLPHPGAEPTFEPGAWVNLKNDAVQDSVQPNYDLLSKIL